MNNPTHADIDRALEVLRPIARRQADGSLYRVIGFLEAEWRRLLNAELDASFAIARAEVEAFLRREIPPLRAE